MDLLVNEALNCEPAPEDLFIVDKLIDIMELAFGLGMAYERLQRRRLL